MSPSLASPTDVDALRQLQRDNLALIAGKLLHDLRNPVHSVRIAVEVFSRIAQGGPAAASVLDRAPRYVGPAQAAVGTLAQQLDRLTVYVGPPVASVVGAARVGDWLADVASLLRESPAKFEVEVQDEVEEAAQWLIDRPRLSHAVLHWCFNEADHLIALTARVHNADTIELTCSAPGRARATTSELRRKVLEAAGAVVLKDDSSALAILLARAAA